jgi:C-terminal processing protease CtpA/Prc
VNNPSKTWRAALTVVIGAGAVLLGMAARDGADLGRSISRDPLTGMLVASNEKNSPQDFDIPERPYFESMAELLKEDYVDPIPDDGKLVSGAARGMVLSLNDPNSLYMDKNEFRVYQAMRLGQFEGIGAELVYKFPTSADEGLAGFPRLMVNTVVPGGPADKAGMHAGDLIDTVNEHWIVNPDVIERFRKLGRDVQDGKASADDLNKLRTDLRKKTEASMLASRARDLLMIGDSGALTIKWVSGTQEKDATITRAKSMMKAVSAEGGVIRLHMIDGVKEDLQSVFPADGVATIDLRNNDSMDLALARDLLAYLGPSGQYGVMKSLKGEEPLTLDKGEAKAKKITFIVDKSTGGGAGILAKGLAAKGLATIQGAPQQNLYAAEVVKMPEGDGFTLVRAMYTATAATKAGKN